MARRLPPPSHVETVNYCFDISLVKINVKQNAKPVFPTETEFKMFSRIHLCTVINSLMANPCSGDLYNV